MSRAEAAAFGATPAHLVWIPAAAVVGFGTSALLGDRESLPVDLYYLIYFAAVLGFLTFYARRTRFEPRVWIARRLPAGLLLGAIGGVVLVRGVLLRPATPGLPGGALAWAVAWRGVAYGSVDGLLLLAFPWIVAWRAFGAERRGRGAKLAAAAVAWVSVLLVTTAYHLGYADFRSAKIAQPVVGSAIGSLPTLLAANPVASPLSHVFLHVAAVIHSPGTDLFLPPHRARASTLSRRVGDSSGSEALDMDYRLAYAIGFHSWEEAGQDLDFRGQISAGPASGSSSPRGPTTAWTTRSARRWAGRREPSPPRGDPAPARVAETA